jgi:hypothetical protein
MARKKPAPAEIRYTARIREVYGDAGWCWELRAGGHKVADGSGFYDRPSKARRSLLNMVNALGGDPNRIRWEDK